MDASFDDSFWLSSTTGAGGAAAFFVTALDIVERGALTYSRRPHTGAMATSSRDVLHHSNKWVHASVTVIPSIFGGALSLAL